MRKVLVEKPPVDDAVQGFSQIGTERKHSASPIYQKIQVTTELETLGKEETKFHDLKDPQRRMLHEDWTGFSERIREWQAKRGYLKFPNELAKEFIKDFHQGMT